MKKTTKNTPYPPGTEKNANYVKTLRQVKRDVALSNYIMINCKAIKIDAVSVYFYYFLLQERPLKVKYNRLILVVNEYRKKKQVLSLESA